MKLIIGLVIGSTVLVYGSYYVSYVYLILISNAHSTATPMADYAVSTVVIDLCLD